MTILLSRIVPLEQLLIVHAPLSTQGYRPSAWLVKRMLTEERVPAGAATARFVGVEAYEAAGGPVLRAGPGPRCISFGAVRVDAAVGAALMRALEPVGIETALAALTARERNDEAAIRLAQSALVEARYKAERAEAQFNAVEPANQNVFHNLARKWEACLSRVRDCEARLQALEASRDRQRELTPEQRDAYLALGEDLQRVWSHESTPPQLRKRLLRAVLVEIIATIKGREIHLLLHWKGGDYSHQVVPRNRTGEHRWTTDAQTGSADPRSGPHAARRVDCRSAQPLGQEDRQGQQLDQNQEIEFRERPSQSVNFRLRPFPSSIQSVAAHVNFHKTLASSVSLHYRPFRIA